MNRISSALLILLLLVFSSTAFGQGWVPGDKLILKGTVLTQDSNHTVLVGGRVCIDGQTIAAVLPKGAAIPSSFEGALEIDTKGVILPGLMNSHNHNSFNFQPIWDADKEYQNRSQWYGSTKNGYKHDVMQPKQFLYREFRPDGLGSGEKSGIGAEMVKYAELKDLVSGTTSVQAAGGRGNMLIRNIDKDLDGTDRIRTQVVTITHIKFTGRTRIAGLEFANDDTLPATVEPGSAIPFGLQAGDTIVSVDGKEVTSIFSMMAAIKSKLTFPEPRTKTEFRASTSNESFDLGYIRNGQRRTANSASLVVTDRRGLWESHLQDMKDGEITAWIVHVAEGTDNQSLREFHRLADRGLIRPETMIIHGTALERPEYKVMADNGANLVWSPLSNRLYYGQTNDIGSAVTVGVNISLGTDWAPGGSRSLLTEMKVVDQIDNDELGDLLSYRDIVDMVTLNPAKALQWDGRLGQIQAGFYADILVLDSRGDPYGSVVHAVDCNVKLVLVNGDPKYGDDEYMDALKGEDCEEVYNKGGRRKLVDITDPEHDDDKSEQTLEEVVNNLADGIDAWNENEKPFNANDVVLSPIFTEGDGRYFDSIAQSINAGLEDFDLEAFWKSPYAQVGDEPTPVEPVQPVDPDAALVDFINSTSREDLRAKLLAEGRKANGDSVTPGFATGLSNALSNNRPQNGYADMEAIDRVPRVGRNSLAALRSLDVGPTGAPVGPIVTPVDPIVAFVNAATRDELKAKLLADARKANGDEVTQGFATGLSNILINNRPSEGYTDLEEIDRVPRIGKTSLTALRSLRLTAPTPSTGLIIGLE